MFHGRLKRKAKAGILILASYKNYTAGMNDLSGVLGSTYINNSLPLTLEGFFFFLFRMIFATEMNMRIVYLDWDIT